MGKVLLKPKEEGKDWDDCGYRANIAMLIYDDQTRGTEQRGEGCLDLNTAGGCQVMADRIIRLMFS